MVFLRVAVLHRFNCTFKITLYLQFSECNLTCDGDPLQMCGGSSRLQVFGPPPSSPAEGHDVLPKCEPWCITADQNTKDVGSNNMGFIPTKKCVCFQGFRQSDSQISLLTYRD